MAKNMGNNAKNIEGSYGSAPTGPKGLVLTPGSKPAASGGPKASGKTTARSGAKKGVAAPISGKRGRK